jgi:methionyl-tRNA formyltransferase
MGTPEFAVTSLERLLLAGHNIVGVITAPDRPAGRGLQVHQSAVKEFALSKGLNLLQPARLRDTDFLDQLRALKADLQLVVAFRMLPAEVWNMPPLGTFNLHASLLPRYRGAAPINWAIINGETTTGVTTFKLRHEIDSGSILLQEKLNITDTMDAGMLHDVLKFKGADLLVKTTNMIRESFTSGRPLKFAHQDESQVTHAPKIFRETCMIKWDENMLTIHNLVRGLSPSPTAFTSLYNNSSQEPLLLKIYKTAIRNISAASPGSIETDHKNYFRVSCNDGVLDLLEVQLQGKKRMFISDFLRGFKLAPHAFMK